jgi:hypothetical protein
MISVACGLFPRDLGGDRGRENTAIHWIPTCAGMTARDLAQRVTTSRGPWADPNARLSASRFALLVIPAEAGIQKVRGRAESALSRRAAPAVP